MYVLYALLWVGVPFWNWLQTHVTLHRTGECRKCMNGIFIGVENTDGLGEESHTHVLFLFFR